MAEKILIVDDDVDSLKLIALMLQRQGYEVIAANAGNQALSKANSEIPDLIILDVMMPDMNGYEVCRRLRANANTKGIPIIMFTAKTLIDDKVAGFEAGADDYLTKPTHPAELAARVKGILQRDGGSSPARSSDSGQQRSMTLGVMGVRGGVGTTTVALNLAAASMDDKLKPIVADFRLGSSTLGLFLGQNRQNHMARVLSRQPAEIKPDLLEQALFTHISGLRSLSSSSQPSEAGLKFQMDSVTAVVRGLRQLSQLVVLDLGSGFNPIAANLHNRVDQLVVLVDPDPASIVMAIDLLSELEKDKPGRANVVVASRIQYARQPTWQDVEKVLKHDIRAIVSAAPDVAYDAVDAGVPLVLHKPDAVVASQLKKLASDLVKNPSEK